MSLTLTRDELVYLRQPGVLRVPAALEALPASADLPFTQRQTSWESFVSRTHRQETKSLKLPEVSPFLFVRVAASCRLWQSCPLSRRFVNQRNERRVGSDDPLP